MSKRPRKDKRHRPSEKKQPVIAETPVTNRTVEWCFRLFDDFETTLIQRRVSARSRFI